MEEVSLSLPITKPVSVWDKPLKADFKGMFKALSKGVAHAALGKWEEIATDAADGLAAVGITTTPEELAWLLIRRAVTLAMFDLLRPSADQLMQNAADRSKQGGSNVADVVCDTLDLTLEESEHTLDRGFFDSPNKLPLLQALKKPLRQWLIGYGMTEAAAGTIVDRLPSHFVYALNREWGRRPSEYAPITKAIETPFTKASELERAWTTYRAFLVRQVEESMFGEPFSLSQIYIPLRAYFEKSPRKCTHEHEKEGLVSRERERKTRSLGSSSDWPRR